LIIRCTHDWPKKFVEKINDPNKPQGGHFVD
jgi:hypothetical protein